MKKKKEQISKAETQMLLLDVMKKINAYWIEEFEAELGKDAVLFPNGIVWLCENCNRIHIGFYLDTPSDLIGHMAIALAEYHERLVFEDMAIFFDLEEVYEGDEAYLEYGKSLMASAFDEAVATDLEIDETESLLGVAKNKRTLQ